MTILSKFSVRRTLAVECTEITVRYSQWGQEVTALDQLNLSIYPGEWVLIIGPNGSGKSTLLRVISGDQRIFSGLLKVSGKSSTESTRKVYSQTVYLVRQNPALGSASDLTVAENLIAAGLRQPSSSCSHVDDRLLSLLQKSGLSGRLNQLAGNLSGGERQLLALTIGAGRENPILLLDEPLAALDPVNSAACLDIISEAHRLGKTILQVTHDLDLAARVGSRCIFLRNGRIVADLIGEQKNKSSLASLWSNT